MNYIWIILTITILISSSLILSLINKKNNINAKAISSEMIIMQPKKIYMILGLCGVILFPLLITLCFLFPANIDYSLWWIIAIGFLILYSLPIYLLFFSLNFKITLYKDYFIYQNFWRIKKNILYKDAKIDKTKLYTRIMVKNNKGKYKTIFKLAGLLDNEINFLEFYKNFK